MGSVHASIALFAFAVSLLLLAGAALATAMDRWHAAVHVAAMAATAVYAVVALLGLAALITGDGPREGLHLLYGAALIAAFPLGLTFASEAPPRSRSGTVAVVATAALLVVWRLFSTG